MAVFFIFFLLLPSAFASEIDEITHLDQPLRDSVAVLDERVQEAFAKALANTPGCDTQAFGAAVAAELVSWHYYSGAIERFLWTDPRIDRDEVAFRDSIYADSPFSRSVIGVTYGLDPVVVLAGQRVGTDKAGHFIDHGHKLYELAAQGADLKALLAHSVEEEEGAFGWLTTGVKSYGDLAANVSGLLFWQNVHGVGPAPYTECRDGRLFQVRPLRLAEYVSAAWSEAHNCNVYADGVKLTDEEGFSSLSVDFSPTNALTRAVERNLRARFESGRPSACLSASPRCGEMRAWFLDRFPPAVAAAVISPLCSERHDE